MKKSFDGLKSFLIILALIASCFLLSLIIVFPLCKWCNLSPVSYSIVFIICVIGYIVFKIVRKIKNSKHEE